MQLKQTVWEEMSIWEDVNNISDFGYSDSEEDEINRNVGRENVMTTTKPYVSFKKTELATTESYKGCNESTWDIDSFFGSPPTKYGLIGRIHT
jgi:hypothetical protein